jgi:hypothetical protein
MFGGGIGEGIGGEIGGGIGGVMSVPQVVAVVVLFGLSSNPARKLALSHLLEQAESNFAV